MKKKAILAIGAYLITLLTVSAHAAVEEPPEQILDAIVVTAKKLPALASSANANITVVSSKDLARNHYATLTEALRDVSGVSASQYGNGVGFSSYNTFKLNGSDKYIVLVDGIRANTNGSPYSSFDFDAVAVDTVERIEILKGAASTLYGADAKGGVINIITRSPKEPKTAITIAGGSFGKESYRLHHENTDENSAWSVDLQKGITGDYTDGHGRTTPSHGNTVSKTLKFTRKLSPDADITFAYNTFQANYAYTIYNASGQPPHIDDGYQIPSQPKNPSPEYQPFTKFMRASTDNDSISLVYRAKLSEKENLLLSLYRNRVDAIYDQHDSFVPWIMDIETIGFDQQYTNRIDMKHTLIGGFNYYQDRVKRYQDMKKAYSDQHVSNMALYLQDDWNFDRRWSLAGGVRFDNHSYAGAHASSSLTLGYQPQNSTQFYLGYREHFVSPNQYQLFGPYSSAGLNPEIGATVELGANHKLSPTAAVKATLFHRKSKDTILYDRSIEKYINAGEETADGWDLRLTKRLTPAWQAWVGYTYTNVETRRDSQSPKAQRDIPKKEATVALVYTKNAWDISLNGHGVFERQGTLYAAQSYWVWNSAVNYKINPSARIYLKVNNLFNKFYSETANSLQLNWEDWYAAPGRNYQFGLIYTL